MKEHKADDKMMADESAYAAGMDPHKASEAWADMAGKGVTGLEGMLGNIFGKGGKKGAAADAPPPPPSSTDALMKNPMLLIGGAILVFFLFMKKK